MRSLIDQLLLARGLEPASWVGTPWAYAVAMLLAGVALTTFAAVFAGLTSYWERRVAARMQSRVGPNRVGPMGLLQWVADALKLILKEDLVSSSADSTLFRAAPYFLLVATVVTFVALPFGYRLGVTTMNVGLFFVASATALAVIGVLLSGWASNSKWSLFGGMRAAAQVVSYEIPAGLALMVPVVMAGSLELHTIIRAQGGAPWDWFVFQTPMGFAAFFILFIALLAEGNRTPFDLPEAESELVSGYNTEYSGIRFGYFFLAEWGNLWVMSALISTLFLGGWQVPGISVARLLEWESSGAVPLAFCIASVIVFCTKVIVLVNVIIWIRWTLPRIRVDQMMALCWKWLVPAALGCLVLAAATEVLSFSLFGDAAKTQAPLASARGALHLAFFAVAGFVPLVRFALKVVRNIRWVADPADLGNW
jgi:NADH-quinone oxidoreductase subunit H